MAPQIRLEGGVVIGNVESKYASQNPITRLLVANFLRAFNDLLAAAGPGDVHEIGCGEGHLAARIKAAGRTVKASDMSRQIVADARRRYEGPGLQFLVRSIYNLTPGEDSADIVVCCEVLEHLDRPEEALERLAAVTRRCAIMSIPREPLWRILNVMRGRYWSRWGNTPGHVQHWSSRDFLRLLQSRFEICAVRHPLPWTMVLLRPGPSAAFSREGRPRKSVPLRTENK